MHLEVRADNSAAIRFYERQATAPSASGADYYEDGTTALLFARQLAAQSAAVSPPRRLRRAA